MFDVIPRIVSAEKPVNKQSLAANILMSDTHTGVQVTHMYKGIGRENKSKIARATC